MPKCIAILQPSYLPWLGHVDQLRRADVFVLYDDVQFDKNGWRNRNRIKSAGGPQWLTVPVLQSGRFGQQVREVEINNTQRWAARHLSALRTNYARAAHFDWCMALLEPLLPRSWRLLVDLDEALLRAVADAIGIRTPMVRSSTLGIGGGQSERLLNICRHFGATDYLSGSAARDYLDVPLFERAGVRVEFQDYAHPVYPQQHGPFISHLSIVDLLMNAGPQAASVLAERPAALVESGP